MKYREHLNKKYVDFLWTVERSILIGQTMLIHFLQPKMETDPLIRSCFYTAVITDTEQRLVWWMIDVNRLKYMCDCWYGELFGDGMLEFV